MSEIDSTKSRARIESVDLLRGLVMILMVLDHVRDFFGDLSVNPTDLTKTSVTLFFTRWITHFCAPVFILLAGTGAFLAGSRTKSRGELARFLFVRGLWLVFLELTIARVGLTFDLTYAFVPLIVLWAVGVSMIVLSALVFLPTPAIAAFGVILIVGHNAFDGARAETLGSWGVVWRILHQQGPLGMVRGRFVFLLYPLIPWVGVMAIGYAMGEVFTRDSRTRRSVFLWLGIAMTVAFVILRATNVYGDPRAWETQSTSAFTVLSFLNCEKYPPSLLYLLMTLGPALIALGLLEHGVGRASQLLLTFGRVPLFYYLLQWYLIHALAFVVAGISGQPARWLLGNGPFNAPRGYGHSLPFVYLMWVVCLILLYPPCAWFARLKRDRRETWLRYF